MTQRITVVPASGRTVPDPAAGNLLPAEGREVIDSAWWRRRLADGDVTQQADGDVELVPAPSETTPSKAVKAATPKEPK